MTPETSPTAEQLARRLERERKARQQAEAVAEGATRELYMTLEEIKSLNQAMRDFVAVAAHDLRTPIATMSGFASLLNENWEDLPDEEKRRYVGIIERSGTVLASLAEDLLTVSRIEAGALETHKEAIEMDSMVRAAMQQFMETSKEIKVSVRSDVKIEADPVHVERILVNYVGNAIKYGKAPIEIDATTCDEYVEIRVRDSGDGVPESFVPRLFSRFARADDVVLQGVAGVGLGLSIVRGLAQANGGDVWYEPNHPNGSCFAVRLPIAAA